MKHRFSRVLAGLLAMILVVSSGSGTVFAKANQKYAAAGVIGTEEPGKTGAPEGDAQNPEKDTTEGKEQTPDTTPEQPSGDTTPPAGQPEEAASDRERQAVVEKLASALERVGELELFEAVMSLEGKRAELSVLLDALESELGARAARGGDRRRLLRAEELVNRLREAARLNVSAGQLAGWLCAGMFEPLELAIV